MTFTDDDVKRLKEFISADEAQTGIRFAIPVNAGKLKGLLARLEAEARCRKYLEAFDMGVLKEGDKVSWLFQKEFYLAMKDALSDCYKAAGK